MGNAASKEIFPAIHHDASVPYSIDLFPYQYVISFPENVRLLLTKQTLTQRFGHALAEVIKIELHLPLVRGGFIHFNLLSIISRDAHVLVC